LRNFLIAGVIAAGIAIPVLGDADALASALSNLASGNIGGAVVDAVSVVLPNIPGSGSVDDLVRTFDDGFHPDIGNYRIDRVTGNVILENGDEIAEEDFLSLIGNRGGGGSYRSPYTYDEHFAERARRLDRDGKPHEGRTGARLEQQLGIEMRTPLADDEVVKLNNRDVRMQGVDYFDISSGQTFDAVTAVGHVHFDIDKYLDAVEDHLVNKTDITIVIDIEELLSVGKHIDVGRVHGLVDRIVANQELGPGIDFLFIPPRS
jgi:hypothetical protein